MCFLGGLITALLVWATGIWDRGVRWPRRWFAVSNRGLRAFNCKLVVMKRPWWKEALGTAAWFLTYGLFSNNGSSYRWVDPALLRDVDRELHLSRETHPTVRVTNWDEEKAGHEEDLAPGGDYVKLLLLAKPFSPTFRENWELYRAEYWDKENERRAVLRAKIKERDRRLGRQRAGWFWWLPGRRRGADKPVAAAAAGAAAAAALPNEKAQHPRHAAVAGEHRRTRSGSTGTGGGARRGSMSSAAGSRAGSPRLEAADHHAAGGLARKASSASSDASAEKRRTSKRLAAPGTTGGGGTKSSRPRAESRSVTPETPSPLARESSTPGSTGSGSP